MGLEHARLLLIAYRPQESSTHPRSSLLPQSFVAGQVWWLVFKINCVQQESWKLSGQMKLSKPASPASKVRAYAEVVRLLTTEDLRLKVRQSLV